jgi:hypothetical protein
VGIKELEENPSIEIFPNPASDWIELSGNEIQSLELYDALGRKVFQSNAAFYRLNVSGYPRGMYFLKTKTKNKSVTQKVILL